MSDPIIAVENLGKRYRIRHQQEGRRYVALRDVLASKLAAPVRRFRQGVRASNARTEDFWALKNVSFEIKQGEVVGIIGRNGAGKSTLLKILSRITEPTEGRVTLEGRVASLLEVGTGFHPELTGRENIFLNGAILGMTRNEIARKFDEIVTFAEVETFLDTPVKRYSSGMYVRLAFAVAAHLEPEILIVDEVLAVGDAMFQKKCLGKIGEVAKSEGRTVLFVSHNMASLQQLCRRVVLLRDGRVVRDGDSASVVREYMAGSQSAGKVSLCTWKDRTTNGDAQIVDFEMCDETGAHTDTVVLGATLRFVITMEFRRPVAQPLFGVLVHTVAGDPILDLRSFHSGLRLDRPQGRVVIEVAVDRIGLYPGEYTLSPWLYDDASKTEVDWARHCCTMRVIAAPSEYGDPRLNPNWGKYFVASNWRLRQHQATPVTVSV